MESRNEKYRHPKKHKIRVVLSDNVYDVTDFAERHPGGKELLERLNGQDVEAPMRNPASHIHSKAAYSILEKCYIGTIDKFKREGGSLQEVSTDASTKADEYYKNDIVDWSKPLLWQVELLGDKYFDWTHEQVDRPIRLFESDFAEMMTKAHWWFVPVTWVPVGLYFLYLSFRNLSEYHEVWPQHALLGCHLGPVSVPFFFVLGVLFWTLLEYVIHRWLFHMRPPCNWPFLIRLHFALHGLHHKSPMDPMHLVFPPLPASFFAMLFFLGCTAMFPKGAGYGVFSGILIGYVVYDVTHYYIHHGQPSVPYFQRLKTYHIHHHFVHQQLGFGISSKLWDYPFGTVIPDDQEINIKES